MAQAALLPPVLPTTSHAPLRRPGQGRATAGDAPAMLQALTSLHVLVRTVTSSGNQPASAAANTPWVALAPRVARGRPKAGAGMAGARLDLFRPQLQEGRAGRARTKASAIASYLEPEEDEDDFVKSPKFQFNQEDISAKATEEKKAKAKGKNAKSKEAPKRSRKYTQLEMEVGRPVDMVGRISGEQDELMRPGIANPAWATASPVGGVAAVVATSSVAAMAPTPPWRPWPAPSATTSSLRSRSWSSTPGTADSSFVVW